MTAQKVDYHQYMASREWALKRKEVKERADNTCERCKSAPVQNVHHLSYEHLGYEDTDTDLLGVCRPCHEFLSGEIPDDPAVAIVLDLIENTGLTPTLLETGDWSRFMDWTTGPTSEGYCFHGDFHPHPQLPTNRFGDYHDFTWLAVPLPAVIWYHCAAY